jgi:DNA-binding SARP family transcriptional activator
MFLLRLFGGASLEDGSAPLSGRAVQRRRLALLAILALEHPRAVGRDRLIAWLWPEHETERARHLLRDSLYLLRSALGEEALASAGDELRLSPQHLRCDVWDFEEAIAQDQPEAAVRTYAGALLEGFHHGGSTELEHWIDTQRERLARAHVQALEELAESAGVAGDHKAALSWWRRLAAEDPYNARVTLRLMQALEAAGDRAGALQQARIHAVLLEQEFGAEPDPEIEGLAERLRTAPAVRPGPPTSSSGRGPGAESAVSNDALAEATATPPPVHVGSASAGLSTEAPEPTFLRRRPARRVVLPAAVAAALGGRPGLGNPARVGDGRSFRGRRGHGDRARSPSRCSPAPI